MLKIHHPISKKLLTVIYDENIKLASLVNVGDEHESATRIEYVTEKGQLHSIVCPLDVQEVLNQMPENSLNQNGQNVKIDKI